MYNAYSKESLNLDLGGGFSIPKDVYNYRWDSNPPFTTEPLDLGVDTTLGASFPSFSSVFNPQSSESEPPSSSEIPSRPYIWKRA